MIHHATHTRSLRQAILYGVACMAMTLAAAVTPARPPVQPKQPAEITKRVSLSEFVKDEKKLASLRKGVKRMRELDSKDPRSWVFQANIHWRPFFPVYVYQQAEQSGDPAQQLFRDDPGFAPDPNVFSQCPHGNWWFLPWHRAYLYYFERILRWAAEDPSLTLPYWNYSDPSQRELPVEFRAPKVGADANPLYLPESANFTDNQGRSQVFLMRDGPLLRGDTQLTASVTSLKALTTIPFTNLKPLPPIAGFASPQACDPTCSCGSGAVEAIPHNRIHTAIGGSQAMAGGAVRIGFMGDVSTAARDPIFWVHHSNIDRLWASWHSLQQDRKNPDDPEWLQYPFTFFDVGQDGKPKPVTISPQDLLTTEQLGYAYDKLEQAPVLVASNPAPIRTTPTGHTFQPLAATAPARLTVQPHAPSADPAGIQLRTASSKMVAVPFLKDVKPDEVRTLLAAKPEERKAELVLSLEGVDFDQPPGVDYEVYLNLPERVKPMTESPYHVGTMTFFGTRHPQGAPGHGKHTAPLYFKFPISQELGKLLATQKGGLEELQVTFVPQTGTEPAPDRKAPALPPDRPAVTIRQIRLLHIR